MKYIVVFLLGIYQAIVSPFIHAATGNSSGCRYDPVCSEYAKQVLMKYGVKKGGMMAIQRVLSCHPFAKPHLDKV